MGGRIATNPLPHGRVLESLYAAGAGELPWDVALGEMADDIGTDIVAVFTEEPASRRPFACHTNASQDIQSVFATWSTVARHQDPVRARLDALPPGQICRSSDVLSSAYYRDSGFYRDYAAQFGGTHFLDVDLARTGNGLLNLCLWSVDRRTPFDDQSMRALDALLPHVARALRLERTLARERLRNDFSLAVLQALSTPVLVIDQRAVITFANAAADDFTGLDNGIRIRHGIVDTTRAQRPSLAARLRLLMSERRDHTDVETIAVPRFERRPLVLTVVLPPPGATVWEEVGAQCPGAIVFVGDPDQELRHVSADLQVLHGLTEREAQVTIGVANGLDPARIAQQEGVGVETIRKHLKQAFAKTGTARQAELVRLVLLELGRHRRTKEG